MQAANVEWWLPFILVGVPPVLLVLTTALARLEAWTDRPERRAAQIVALLDDVDTPDELEEEVARILADVATPPKGPTGRERIRRLPSIRRFPRSLVRSSSPRVR